MRDAALTSASQRVPAPRRIFVASSGSARVRSEVNASPRSLSASSAAAAARSIQPAGSSARSLCATTARDFARSRAATARVHAASTTPASSCVTTQSVLRIPSIRTSVRSS